MTLEGRSSVARRLRWRHYEAAAGRRPVLEFIRRVPDVDKAAILAAMKDVRRDGVKAARHLRGDLFEVRADGDRVIYRVLFAREGMVVASDIDDSLFDISKNT